MDFGDETEADRLAMAADRLDELADTAELMGDDGTAARLREQSSRARMAALRHNDTLESDEAQITFRASE